MKVILALLLLPVAQAFAPVSRAASSTRLEAKKSVAELSKTELEGKKVLVRCDLNVPLDGAGLHRRRGRVDGGVARER